MQSFTLWTLKLKYAAVIMLYTLSALGKKNQQCYFRQIAGSSNHVLFFHWGKDIPKGKYEQEPFTPIFYT